MRKLLISIAASSLALSLAACGGDDDGSSGGKGTVGVAMPTKSSERWIADGNNIEVPLEEPATTSTCSTPRTTSRPRSPRSRT